MNDAVESYVSTHSKSYVFGFLLTFLLGPLGLFYSSWVAALILCVIAISTASTIVVPLFCWALAILINFPAVSRHNEKVRTTANLAQST
jgi:hypothetical protein